MIAVFMLTLLEFAFPLFNDQDNIEALIIKSIFSLFVYVILVINFLGLDNLKSKFKKLKILLN